MLSRVILIAITSGCAAVNLNAAQSPDETAIREILRAQTEAWSHGDGIAWAREFRDDSDFVNLRGDTLHGRGEIGARVTASFQTGLKRTHLSLTIRQFNLLTPDVALVETDYETLYRGPEYTSFAAATKALKEDSGAGASSAAASPPARFLQPRRTS
ncbi:MAG: SgcJ/EcaC family oxidoreductase [Bryobacteraceae bacterium]|jgi:uncharacterized protein (TIGR02246 family)